MKKENLIVKNQKLEELLEVIGLTFGVIDDNRKEELLNMIVSVAFDAHKSSVVFTEKKFNGITSRPVARYTIDLLEHIVRVESTFESRNDYLPICSKKYNWLLEKDETGEKETLFLIDSYYDGTSKSLKRQTTIFSNHDRIYESIQSSNRRVKQTVRSKSDLILPLNKSVSSTSKTYEELILDVPTHLKQQRDFIFEALYGKNKVKAINKK